MSLEGNDTYKNKLIKNIQSKKKNAKKHQKKKLMLEKRHN